MERYKGLGLQFSSKVNTNSTKGIEKECYTNELAHI